MLNPLDCFHSSHSLAVVLLDGGSTASPFSGIVADAFLGRFPGPRSTDLVFADAVRYNSRLFRLYVSYAANVSGNAPTLDRWRSLAGLCFPILNLARLLEGYDESYRPMVDRTDSVSGRV